MRRILTTQDQIVSSIQVTADAESALMDKSDKDILRDVRLIQTALDRLYDKVPKIAYMNCYCLRQASKDLQHYIDELEGKIKK